MSPAIPALRRAEALCRRGDLAEAAAAYREALRAAPDHAGARHNLGLLLLRAGDPAGGLAQLERAAEIEPARADVRQAIGRALAALGRARPAEAAFREAVRLDPAAGGARVGLANLLLASGRAREAEATLRDGLARAPDDDAVEATLGVALAGQARWGEAAAALARVVERSPGNRAALRNLVQAENRLKRADRVLDLCARYLELDPGDAGVGSTLAMTSLYVSGDAAEALRLARRWAGGRAPAAAPVRHPNSPDPERRLRVGIVSRHLRGHPVGRFVAGFARAHDRDRIELLAYADPGGDGLTEALRPRFAAWTGVAEDDAALARRIARDRVDVLVDGSGLEAGNRLALFAAAPAPVRATAFGHCGTTGLAGGHILVADRHHVPEGHERFYSERVVRLPGPYVCYEPPADAPPVAPPPALAAPGGAVTFGCHNNLLKLSDAALALWARVMARRPDATLLLRDRELDDVPARDGVRARAAAAGIDPARLRLCGGLPHREFLASYREVDVALDPHPYSGGLTTLEALLMGVPVVTLAGETFCSRHSTSHLRYAGLGHLATSASEAYVEAAVALAADVEGLARLRATLRARLTSSPICDAAAYSRALEACLREAWREWCLGAARAR